MLPPDDSPVEVGTVAPADGTPTSWSAQLTRAPPLLPGLIAASVCTAATSSAALVVLGGHLDGPVERAHDAGGHRAGQAERRAERDHRVADLQRRSTSRS